MFAGRLGILAVVGALAVPLGAPAAVAATAPAAGAPTASPTASRSPAVDLTLRYQRVGKVIRMKVRLNGYVFEPLDSDGTPIPFRSPAGIDIGTGQAWEWGDQGEGGTDAGDVHCGRPHRLRQLVDTFTLTRTYEKAGTYTFKYSFHACGLNRAVTGVVPIRIP
jgi:hypothetical protein